MDPRTIFNYKCHTCKQTKEPGEFGHNSQTRTLRVTCNTCHQKRTERAANLRTSRLETPAVVVLDLETSEGEERCENACASSLECYGVRCRFTCSHRQCVMTHLVLGRCIACGCSELRFGGEVMIPTNPTSSSSGPAVPENEAEPEAEPEPEIPPNP